MRVRLTLRWLTNIAAIILLALAIHRLATRQRPDPLNAPRGSFDPVLERTVPPIHLARVSFAQAAAELQRLSGVKIVIDSAPDAGIFPGVTLDRASCRLEDDLWALIAADKGPLTIVVRNGEVHIVSPSAAPKLLQIYDVRDLVEKIVSDAPPTYDPSKPKPPPIGIFAPGYPTVPAGATRQQVLEMEAMDQIDSLISSNVTPEDWIKNGGTIAWSHGSNGWLVITHTPEGQYRLQRLLDKIRRAGRMSP